MVIKDWEKVKELEWKNVKSGIIIRTKIRKDDIHPYNVQILCDKYYCGNGKFCKTKIEVVKYARAYMRKNY